MSYSQLTQKKRYEISALNERDIPQYQIANQVNVDPSTISRELNRNDSQDGYDPDEAHRQAEERQQDKNRTRIDQDDWDQVEKLLQLDWSVSTRSGSIQSRSLCWFPETGVSAFRFASVFMVSPFLIYGGRGA